MSAVAPYPAMHPVAKAAGTQQQLPHVPLPQTCVYACTIVCRRFPLQCGTSALFQFVDAKWAPAGGWEVDQAGSQQYQLVAQYPRRVISRPPPGAVDVTLQQLELSDKVTELFNVEVL